MKLNFKEKGYTIPEKTTFGYLYMINDRMKRAGTSFMRIVNGMNEGDFITLMPSVIVGITGLQMDEVLEEIEKLSEDSEKFADTFVEVLEVFTALSDSAAFEGFMKAVEKMDKKAQAKTTAN